MEETMGAAETSAQAAESSGAESAAEPVVMAEGPNDAEAEAGAESGAGDAAEDLQGAPGGADEAAAIENDPDSMVKNHPLFKEQEARLAQYESEEELRAVRKLMAEDLAAIREIDPEVESLESIEGYAELVARGITGSEAYYILLGRKGGRTKQIERLEAQLAQRNENAERYHANKRMREDLEAIREIDPVVESLENLEGYLELAEQGIFGVNAYYILKGREAVLKARMPPSTGKVGGENDSRRDLSGEELDRLSEKDLIENDSLFERAQRSMKKLMRR